MWKSVHGYESLYEVSDGGLVRRKAGFWCKQDRLLKLHEERNGYIRVRLTNRTRQGEKFSVHRLVHEHFNGPIPEGMTVNHINGNKQDNRASNLELATMREQMLHAYSTGLQKICRGEERGKVAKLTTRDIMDIRELYARGGHTYQTLADIYGVSNGCIGTVVKRTRWRHII
jgi:hypothetical protein